jgi:phosphoribosylformylglycinamidine (FGAM) synthase-like enzyme
VGLIQNYNAALSISFKQVGDQIWLIGETFNETNCPKLNWQKEKALHEFLQNNISIRSCHDLSEGGLLLALSECLLASNLGAQIEIEKDKSLRLDSLLFGESQSRALVTTAPNIDLEKFSHSNLKITKVGLVSADCKLTINLRDFGEIVNLSNFWKKLAK